MKQLIFRIFSYITVFSMVACDKDVKVSALASLNVVNAVIGGDNVKLNTNIGDSARTYTSKLFTINVGNNKINLYPTGSPGTSYYSNTLQIDNRSIHSIFLGGSSSNVEAVVVKENLPAFYSDSSFGVRVINLSPNSAPINITLAADSKTSIFTNIAYKQITDFIKLPLATAVPASSVSFQVRKADTQDLLVVYTLPVTVNSKYPNISIAATRFRNITLVVKGLFDTTSGSDAFGIFPVAHY